MEFKLDCIISYIIIALKKNLEYQQISFYIFLGLEVKPSALQASKL